VHDALHLDAEPVAGPKERAAAFDRWTGHLRTAAGAVAIACAAWQLSIVVRLFASRWSYPFDIDWLEGSTLYQAFRHQHGQRVWGPLDQGYLPLSDPPLYELVLSWLGRVWRLDYGPARALSFAFFVVIGWLGAREVQRHDPDDRFQAITLGVLACGIAAAAAPVVGTFYDLIREDMMAWALCAVAASLASAKRWSTRRIVAMAVIACAAVYTRLVSVFILAWIVAFVFARHRRAGLQIAVLTTAFCGLALVAMQFASGGWYWILTVALHAKHPVGVPQAIAGVGLCFAFAPFLLALPLLALVLGLRRRLRARTVLWLGVLCAAFPAALLPFAKLGGFANDLMPVMLFLGPATVLLLADAVRALPVRWQALVAALTYLALAGFLLMRGWDSRRFRPDATMARRAREVNALVGTYPDGVLVPRHPFLPVRNGIQGQQYAEMPYMDAEWAGYRDLGLGTWLDTVRAPHAIVSGTESAATAVALSARYDVASQIPPMSAYVGDSAMLRWLLVRHEEPEDVRVLFDFEELDYAGWSATGDAFVAAGPTRPREPWHLPISGAQGKRLLNSFTPKKGDQARGRLRSEPFDIDRPRLALRVGGGTSFLTRVDLEVDGRVVRTAGGVFLFHEVLTNRIWDVSDFVGRQGRLVLVDDDAGPWGHLLCDQVVLHR
jgi:hypothetical protein